jgi:hypothetical protein
MSERCLKEPKAASNVGALLEGTLASNIGASGLKEPMLASNVEASATWVGSKRWLCSGLLIRRDEGSIPSRPTQRLGDAVDHGDAGASAVSSIGTPDRSSSRTESGR